MTGAVLGRLLICGDGERSNGSLGNALGAAGFDVIHVSSAAATLREAQRRRPAAVVIDLDATDGSGHAACHELRRFCGDALTIVFVSSDRTEPRDRVAGLLAGADDYLAKPLLVEELVLRIRRRLELARMVSARGASELTPREFEVLELLAAGMNETEVAASLYISAKTVATHIQHILRKLEVHSRAQAIAFAYRAGLLTSFDDVT